MARNAINLIRPTMREYFQVPENYFLSHSVGGMPRQLPGHFETNFFRQWKSVGGGAWPDWLNALDEFRTRIGALLNTPGDNICPQTNVSSALTKILYSLSQDGQRKTILFSRKDFPTVGFVFKQAERAGYKLRFVEGDELDSRAWEDCLDNDVAIVLVTHAFSNNSHLTPVASICALAREAGVYSIVDCAQSVGIVPIDVQAWNADFVIGTGVKFLCCGPGACFLYVSQNVLGACQPMDAGWFSHEDPFEMDITQFRFAKSAMRFFGGTPSPAPFILANSALCLWDEIGLTTAQTRAQTLLSALVDCVRPEALVSPTDKQQRGGTLVVAPPDRVPLRENLKEAAIQFDEREEGFRFSVHGYTSDEEVKLLINVLGRSL